MVYESRFATAKLVLLLLAATAFVMFLTLSAAYLFSAPPRSFMFWLSTGAACFIEFLVGMFFLNSYARSATTTRPSYPMLIPLFLLLVGYAVALFASLLVYWGLRDPSGSGDLLFCATLGLETGVFALIAALVYGWDAFFTGQERAVTEQRAEHKAVALSLHEALSGLDAVSGVPEAVTWADKLRKRLRSAENALAHSHGGGMGSFEAGTGQRVAPADAAALNEVVPALNHAAGLLASTPPAQVMTGLAEVETLSARLTALIERMGLA